MRNKRRQLGVTLVEMMVVVAIAALMVGLTIPAANMLLNSFESESGAKSIISAAMASARAIAAKEQRYAGIRFQKRYDPNNLDQLNVSQYIIFIVQDPNMDHASGFGFRAVEGIQPIKLPDSISVMDLTIVTQRNKQHPDNPTQLSIDDPVLGNSRINDVFELLDTTTFSIIFSPSGKLVIHGVWVRNKNGISDYPSYPEQSYDDIFNKKSRVDAGLAMFYQDDYWGDNAYPNIGFGPEPSRNNFVIYDTKKLKQTDTNLRWTNYLYLLKRFYINPYTGTIINEK
jgi:prepilin-type N-terminal cleavage/methylation domain-containing protein